MSPSERLRPEQWQRGWYVTADKGVVPVLYVDTLGRDHICVIRPDLDVMPEYHSPQSEERERYGFNLFAQRDDAFAEQEKRRKRDVHHE